jgi:hypothetical protein
MSFLNNPKHGHPVGSSNCYQPTIEFRSSNFELAASQSYWVAKSAPYDDGNCCLSPNVGITQGWENFSPQGMPLHFKQALPGYPEACRQVDLHTYPAEKYNSGHFNGPPPKVVAGPEWLCMANSIVTTYCERVCHIQDAFWRQYISNSMQTHPLLPQLMSLLTKCSQVARHPAESGHWQPALGGMNFSQLFMRELIAFLDHIKNEPRLISSGDAVLDDALIYCISVFQVYLSGKNVLER